MNIQSIFLAAVALIVGLTACNKEESLSQDGLPENAVRITATIGNPFAATRSNPVGTVEEQAIFNSGDKILVTKFNNNNREKVVYQFNGSTWVPSENKYLLWANNSESEEFYAKYPLNSRDEYGLEYVQADQSKLENLAKSDLMRAEMIDATKADVLKFEMQRQTSRIIVKIAGFNPEFPTDSKVTDVKIAALILYDMAEDYLQVNCTPYPSLIEDGKIGSSYTLLADAYMNDMYVSLKVGDKELRSANLPSNMNSGKSYTFNLIVGKEKLEIESVTVADWSNGETIPGGEAGEFD